MKWWQPEYKRKADLVDEIRRRVNAEGLSLPVHPDNEAFFLWVLTHHHEFEEKRGCGIHHLEVRENWFRGMATRGLWIVRTDGSEIDISWVTALKPNGAASHKDNVVAAARREVADQIEAFRADAWVYVGSPCDLCGAPLLAEQPQHVDHVTPFDELLHDFVAGDYSLIQTKDEGLYGVFQWRSLAYAWRRNHQSVAKLRMVHAVCNLRRGRK